MTVDILARLVARYPALESLQADIVGGFTLLLDCVEGGGTILACGNGGSAADADHIVGELLKGFQLKRSLTPAQVDEIAVHFPSEAREMASRLQQGIPAVALSGANAIATAVANDTSPEYVFAQQVYGLGRRGDVLIAISTSGNSGNVLAAAKVARARGLKVLALTGRKGGKLWSLADVAIRVPADVVDEIQELHLPVYHCLCSMLEQALFGAGGT
ncbi:MAG: SIS domain-containing protein [Alphaproteobacteria bacterium]|nr:SIS domain-containing protein [Alphaproteobacteria bacterium]MBF0129754.1 SIS domain-containing protein [Alphaproteobacteria bacterium]